MCPPSKLSRVVEGNNIGSSVYLLNCSICKGEFNCRQSWVEHLTSDEHQKLAKDFVQKDGSNVRECSLMIFTTYDLTVEGARIIVQYFGKDPTIWVTDFLWWTDRPRIAIIQFESRKKVKQVLREVKSISDDYDLIRIGNQCIQVKGSLDLLDLEWKAILPGSNPASIVPPKSLQRSASANEATGEATKILGKEEYSTDYVKRLFDLAEKRKWKPPEFKFKRMNVTDEEIYYLYSVIINRETFEPHWFRDRAKTSVVAKQIAAKLCLEALETKEHTVVNRNIADDVSDPSSVKSPNNLGHQFEVISKAIEIPDGECQQVLEIVRSFRYILRKKFPSTQVIIFRNWYLKLKNLSSEIDPLLIYVYAEQGCPGDNTPPRKVNISWSSKRKIKRYIKQYDNNELFLRADNSFPESRDSEDTRLGCKFMHKLSGLSFCVVSNKETLAEVQCSRLVKYFCEFDPRIRPLFILTRYWMITNKIHWGEPEVAPAKYSHACLPEPHPLDWMILTFFMWEGHVPSLRTILERPHRIFSIRKKGPDLGFDADVDFARGWKHEKGVKTENAEQFNIGILQIFQNFLEFCSSKIFDQGGVIINPKDGEILETRKFLSGELTSKLTPDEIEALKKLQENYDNKKEKCSCVNFAKLNWYVIHPLIIHWQCSAPGKKHEVATIRTTSITNERLKNLIKLIDDVGAEKAFQICGASLCEILKVDKEVPAIDPILRSSRKRTIGTLENQEENELEKGTSIKVPRQEEPVTGEAKNLGRVPPPQINDENSLAYQFYSLLEETVVTLDNALLEYICKFDWRAYYLIKMAYLWMGLNGLTLGEAGSVKEDCVGLSSLQWLVIFWMSHTKMVPSPGTIGERVIMDTDGGISVDLGREEDDKCLEEWREREGNVQETFEWEDSCVVSLLNVFIRFLEFCGWLAREGHWVLNTKLGEMIKKKKLLNSEFGDVDWCKTMSNEELSILRAQVYSLNKKWIYMTHPLNLQWRFVIRDDIEFVLKLMKAGGVRLRKYLNMKKSNGKEDVQKRFKSLRNVFTLSDEDLNKKKK